MILVLFYVWEDARVWAHRNSLDLHLNPLGPVACFSPSGVPLRANHEGGRSGWRLGRGHHSLLAEMTGHFFFVWNPNYLELGVGGSVPQDPSPHFRHQSQGSGHRCFWPTGCKLGASTYPPPPRPPSLDISLNDSRNSGKCFPYCCRFTVNDRVL